MRFRLLASYLEKLEATSSRIEITKILSDLFKKASSEDIDKIVYLLLGSLAPKFRNVVFNIADRMVLQIIAKAYQVDLDKVKNIYRRKGDLGDVANNLAKKKGKDLSVKQVYQRLEKIALEEGKGSVERKIEEASKLLSDLDPLSAKFVVRIPVGRLRLGFSDKTILDALSWMENGDKSAKADLEKAYNVLPDVGALAKKVKKEGIIKATRKPVPETGVPILPMLAQRLKSPKEMIEKMTEVSVEPKFDGLRTQIHYRAGKKGFIKAYTRNLNEISWMFPELKEIVKYLSAEEVILDSEAMGVDEERKSLANFQQTMTRRRKHQIEEISKKVSIKFYVFDILLKNKKSYLQTPYLERRKVLKKAVKQGKLLQIVDYKVTRDPQEIAKEMMKEVSEGLEGVIVKKVDSMYVPGRTGWRWVKMKEEESKASKLLDNVDCVVLGYSAGKGRRAGFGVGQFLVGIPDPSESGKIKTISKIGTGLTDDQFRELKKRLKKLEVKEKPKEYKVHKDLEPDYWVVPSQVVEIAADEITKSPKHTAGYALRFPRLIKFRDDKTPDQATNISELIKLYKLQRN